MFVNGYAVDTDVQWTRAAVSESFPQLPPHLYDQILALSDAKAAYNAKVMPSASNPLAYVALAQPATADPSTLASQVQQHSPQTAAALGDIAYIVQPDTRDLPKTMTHLLLIDVTQAAVGCS